MKFMAEDEGALDGVKALSYLKESKERRAKWSYLTEKRSRFDSVGVSGEKGLSPFMRRKMEVMFENTVSWINDQSDEGGRGSGINPVGESELAYLRGEVAEEDATTTANISAFTTAAFPLIRRVYPNLISNFLVAIQPIPLPVVQLFFLDFKYGSNFAPIAKGDAMNLRDVVSGATRMQRARNYARGVITGEAVGTGDGSNATFYLAYFPIKAASVTIYVSGSPVTTTSIDYETGKVVLTAAPAGAAAVTADYSLVFEGTGPIGQVYLDMSNDTATAESYKLLAKWSLESAQDAAVYHGLDIDSELLTVMAEEIVREIDARIITDLYTAATSGTGAGNVNWSQTVGSGYSPSEWERTFISATIDASQLIHTLRLRYANWLVGGDDIITRLTKMAGFNPNIGMTPGGGVAGTLDQANTPVVNGQGPVFLGTLNSRYAIFHDPVHLPAGKALMGYRGQSMLDTGYIYAPYQPLYITPTLIDPSDQTPKRGVMTRAAFKLVSANFYATVTVTA